MKVGYKLFQSRSILAPGPCIQQAPTRRFELDNETFRSVEGGTLMIGAAHAIFD